MSLVAYYVAGWGLSILLILASASKMRVPVRRNELLEAVAALAFIWPFYISALIVFFVAGTMYTLILTSKKGD